MGSRVNFSYTKNAEDFLAPNTIKFDFTGGGFSSGFLCGFEDGFGNAFKYGFEDGVGDGFEDGYKNGFEHGFEDGLGGSRSLCFGIVSLYVLIEDGFEHGFEDGFGDLVHIVSASFPSTNRFGFRPSFRCRSIHSGVRRAIF